MKRWLLVLLLLTLALLLVGAGNNAANVKWTIVYSGAAHGKITPCACSAETDMGGLLRRDTALLELAKQAPDALLLDAGGQFDVPSPQNRAGAAAMSQALKIFGYHAAAIGPNEMLYGRSFLEEQPCSYFVSNVRWKHSPSVLTQPARNFEREGQTVEVFALINPADVFVGDQSDIEVDDPARFLRQNGKPNTPTIVLCATDSATAKSWLKLPEVEIVINAKPDGDILVDPSFLYVGGKIYTEGAIYGSRLGVLEVTFRRGATVKVLNRFVQLDNTVADGIRVADVRQAYEAETKRMFLARLLGQPKISREQSPYAGSKACSTCHAKIYREWKKTRHFHAWASLQKVKKTFDPECVECHVVGYQTPGGFLSEEDTPHLTDVGCESCHGPAKAHAKPRGAKMDKITLKKCLFCHNAERSPAFKPEVAWDKIKHKEKRRNTR